MGQFTSEQFASEQFVAPRSEVVAGMPGSLEIDGSVMRPLTQVSVFGFRLAAAVLSVYWLAIFAGTHLPGHPQALPRIDDKLIHFCAYFVLVILMSYTTTSPRLFRRFLIIGAIAMVYGAIDELTQTFVPRRQCDVWDFAADAAGIWAAIALYLFAKYIFEAKSSPTGTDSDRQPT